MDYSKIALITINGGNVHLNYSFNPDAGCSQNDPTGTILQLEEYDARWWNEPKRNADLATSFWNVWSEWNGRVTGGITLHDENTEADAEKLIASHGKWVTPDQIKDLQDGKYVVYDDANVCNLHNTTPADDIDMLINLVCQASDYISPAEPFSTQIPDPTRHCKYWEEVGSGFLCDILREKYANAGRTEIPAENLTNC